MSDKTNDEKIRILQERLAQIKGKQDTASARRKLQEEVIEVDPAKNEIQQKEKSSILFKWLLYIFIIIWIVYGGLYAYNNIDFNTLKSDKTDTTKIDEIKDVKEPLRYNLDLTGDNIAIINSVEDESSAKAMVNDLSVKGFKCNYFFLPNKSNSTEEVYKIFIGPYESLEEVNQWKENINGEVEILNL
tara:strand:- start:289 stop:852 length:564 start_codon:yes stop_codon:yes gene_type:complete